MLLFIVLLFLFILLIFMYNAYSQQENKTASVNPEEKDTVIRKAAVAGSFYPAAPDTLNSTLDNFLNKTNVLSDSGKLRILIVPHAGIEYSGLTAAWGFKQIAGQEYKRVILLGVSHHYAFDHAAVYAGGAWETPLGTVPVDEGLADAVIDENEKIINDTKPHADEHALEMELLFLQKMLKDFRILPILVSNPSDKLIETLSGKIADNFDDSTLFVVSSDLSHYPAWQDANEADQKTIDAIVSGQEDQLENAVTENESKNYPNLQTSACGFQALRIALKTAALLQIKNFKKIFSQNSGDVTGDKSRVVGYGAIGGWIEQLPEKKEVDLLDENARKEALDIARLTLKEYLAGKVTPEISAKNKVLSLPYGAFVTLKKNGEVRGCIGEFDPKDPLIKVIQSKTIAAASQDSRFSPVQKDELNDLDIEISVMTPRRKIANWKDIRLGRQGVYLLNGNHTGTFLPQVETETGWSKEKFLGELCSQKAGLPSQCYMDPNSTLYVFDTQVFGEKDDSEKRN